MSSPTLAAPGRLPLRPRVLARLAGMGFSRQLVYGVAYWAQMVQKALLLVIAAAFWKAVYGGQTVLAGLDVRTALSYVLLARLFQTVSMTGLLRTFGQLNYSGDLSIELLRPVDFQSSQFAQDFGWGMADLCSQLPIMVPVALLLGMRPTHDPMAWFGALVVLLLGMVCTFLFDWIIACLAFFTTYTWGLTQLYGGFIWLLSGALVPLTFMPGWLQAVCRAVPASQVVAVPAGLLSGQTAPSQVPLVVAGQLVFIAVLAPLSRWVFRRSVQHATVQGG